MLEWLLWGLRGSQYCTGEILVFALSFLHANRENRLSGEVLTAKIIPATRGTSTSRQLLGTVAAIRFLKYKIKTNVSSMLCFSNCSHWAVRNLNHLQPMTRSYSSWWQLNAIKYIVNVFLGVCEQRIVKLHIGFHNVEVFVCGGEECVCVMLTRHLLSINYTVVTCWEIKIKIFSWPLRNLKFR